jgi:hypothetical protein
MVFNIADATLADLGGELQALRTENRELKNRLLLAYENGYKDGRNRTQGLHKSHLFPDKPARLPETV